MTRQQLHRKKLVYFAVHQDRKFWCLDVVIFKDSSALLVAFHRCQLTDPLASQSCYSPGSLSFYLPSSLTSGSYPLHPTKAAISTYILKKLYTFQSNRPTRAPLLVGHLHQKNGPQHIPEICMTQNHF